MCFVVFGQHYDFPEHDSQNDSKSDSENTNLEKSMAIARSNNIHINLISTKLISKEFSFLASNTNGFVLSEIQSYMFYRIKAIMTSVVTKGYKVHEISNYGMKSLKIKPVLDYFSPDVIVQFTCLNDRIWDVSLTTNEQNGQNGQNGQSGQNFQNSRNYQNGQNDPNGQNSRNDQNELNFNNETRNIKLHSKTLLNTESTKLELLGVDQVSENSILEFNLKCESEHVVPKIVVMRYFKPEVSDLLGENGKQKIEDQMRRVNEREIRRKKESLRNLPSFLQNSARQPFFKPEVSWKNENGLILVSFGWFWEILVGFS